MPITSPTIFVIEAATASEDRVSKCFAFAKFEAVISEFKDDIVELIIDEAVSILAGDIESGNQYSRGQQEAERNN